jgi:cyclopropane-fatty-acyl-phospholipid synthase
MANYLAATADVEVVGVTLSAEQRDFASARAKERGLQNRVRFELKDYREVTGCFDRIVSLGMFEHVGVRYYPTFFAKARDLLVDSGVMLLHAVGCAGGPGATGPWLRKYIFPGGYAPGRTSGLVGHGSRNPAPALCRHPASLGPAVSTTPR